MQKAPKGDECQPEEQECIRPLTSNLPYPRRPLHSMLAIDHIQPRGDGDDDAKRSQTVGEVAENR